MRISNLAAVCSVYSVIAWRNLLRPIALLAWVDLRGFMKDVQSDNDCMEIIIAVRPTDSNSVEFL